MKKATTLGNYVSTEVKHTPVHAQPTMTKLPTRLIIHTKTRNYVCTDAQHFREH